MTLKVPNPRPLLAQRWHTWLRPVGRAVKSTPIRSSRAVLRIQSGMASSLDGYTNRLIVITQVSARARAVRPTSVRMSSSPNRFQNGYPT